MVKKKVTKVGAKKAAPADAKAAGKAAARAARPKAATKKPAAAGAKAAPAKAAPRRAPSASAIKDTVSLIKTEARQIERHIVARQKPSLRLPLRALANVKYSVQRGYFEMKGKSKERTLTVNTVKTFAQTLRMMALSKELVEQDDIASKREAYYVSKNWDDARFLEQPESDTVMEDLEALFSVNREQLGFIPEEKGGDVAGQLVVIDRDRDTGETLRIDCTKFGSGAYSIPISVEHLRLRDQGQLHPGHRDLGHVPAAGQAQLLARVELHPGVDGGRAHARVPPVHSPAGRREEDPGLRVRGRRSLRVHEHLPHARRWARATPRT